MTNEPEASPRRHKWPWFVLAAFILGVVLAVLWISYAVHAERKQRDFSEPILTH